GELMVLKNDIWQPVSSLLPLLTSYAIDAGLPKADIGFHFERYSERFEPEFLIDIPAWDGIDRVKSLCNFVKVSNVSKNTFYELLLDWGVRMLARIYRPSIQNKVLIFKGPQGIGKDFFINQLLSALGPFFVECQINVGTKDLSIDQSEVLAIHISEFDKTNRNSSSQLKSMITKEKERIRKPYARSSKILNMRASFISSANVDVLNDPTGSRRFIILDIESIDWGYEKGQSIQILAQFNHF